MTSSLTQRSLLVLFLLVALIFALIQTSHAKDRIRYHINGPDGSTLRVVDAKGIAVESYRYAPFGEQLTSKRPHNLHGQQGFVGGIHESNDLVYLKHRYYNPRIGRFYQPDPVTFLSGGMGQINRYQYGWNDPLTFKDPSGMQSTGQTLDEAALRAAAGNNGSFSPALAALVFGKTAWDYIGFEEISLASDGQKYSKSGVALDILGFFGVGKLGKLATFNRLNPCGCFDDDTPITTPAGLQRIVDLKVGDLVLAKDEKTGALAFKPITQHFVIPNREIYKLTLRSSEGVQSVLEVSDDHPFWVIGQGWVKSIDLVMGSQLLSDRQQVVTVTGLSKTLRVETTYNLEVADYHTFFAGKQPVWVHNCPNFEALYRLMPNVPKAEINRLASRWDMSTFTELERNFNYHFTKHGKNIGADDLITYLRKADGFNTRGAQRGLLKEDGSQTFTRTNGTFMIMRDGKIVSFGRNIE